jgi:L-cysteine:1D-myo-inositol 2-amino-2-deoxy-alpha-D-glucopyranoside ligase
MIDLNQRWKLKLYNTLSQSVEPFESGDDEIGIYVCGITPYDTTHLGHAFTYTSADILIRYLELLGQDVRYVQNVTDIDDDILRKAKEVGEDWRAVGNRWTVYYIRDMQNLNVRPPDYFPRATDVIPDIIEAVQALIEAGVAYEILGNVYFEVDSWADFGKLSHLPRSSMLPIANERGNHPDDPNKKNPLDFVLWQAKAPGEPFWDSPWGAGRPGWHIECSTMATKYIGDRVDVHGGGADLCFPHHEAEIAQTEPATKEKPFVRFWTHTAMVRYQGEKMSKSLGNLIMVRDLLKVYPADALRLYLGSHHYREAWEHDEDDLMNAEQSSDKIREAILASGGTGVRLNSEPYWASFTLAMDNDLDTHGAIQVMLELADDILEGVRSGRDVGAAQEALRSFGKVFGLRMEKSEPEARVKEGWNVFLGRFEY